MTTAEETLLVAAKGPGRRRRHSFLPGSLGMFTLEHGYADSMKMPHEAFG